MINWKSVWLGELTIRGSPNCTPVDGCLIPWPKFGCIEVDDDGTGESISIS